MDLDFTMEEEQFRAEVRAFLKAKLPARIADKVRTGKRLTKKDHEEWHAILHERGWLASPWPHEYGGPGWTTAQAHILHEVFPLDYAPGVVPLGRSMRGPGLTKAKE